MNEKRRVIGGDVDARSAEGRSEMRGEMPVQRKPLGALVEDETLSGTESGGVVPKGPDGKIDEGATDRRELR